MREKNTVFYKCGVCGNVIGLIDGFNPCAMWVLLFLISVLIGMKNKKRMWSLGIAFLLFHFVYDTWMNIGATALVVAVSIIF